MDTDWNARKFIRIAKPSVAIFIKYEFWINYLSQLKKHHIPTYIVSAIFRDSQAFFKWYGSWYRKLLKNYNHLFVQDQNSIDLLSSIGIKNASIAGDTRCDRVVEIARLAKELPIIKAFKGEKKILVAGSSWPKDENLFIPYFNKNKDFKLIIAPHQTDENHIKEITGKLERPYVRYTQTSEEEAQHAECLIIDCIGLLSSIYRYGEIAYIGGGFGAGIHNILEAAVYGMPVIFGPNYKKFREAVEIIKSGAGFPIDNEEELTQILDELLNTPQTLAKTSAIARRFVDSNCGATEQVVKAIFGE
jgi:3-deoxy-D-manno-octulosonic-acid transferase